MREQADEMQRLQQEYSALFSGVTSVLQQTNNNWSELLANNFAGKIASAQKSFSGVVYLLGYGATAANASAEQLQSVDTQLARVMSQMLKTSSGKTTLLGNSQSILQTVFPGVDRLVYNATHFFSENTGVEVSDVQISAAPLGRNTQKAVKDYYDNYIDSHRSTVKDSFTWTSADEPTTGSIADGVNYTRTRDVRTLYGEWEKSEFHTNAQAGETIVGEQIEIYTTIASEPDIIVELNKADLHILGKLDPQKGDIYGSMGAEWDAVAVTLQDSDRLSVTGKVGIGASVTAGISDGKFTLDVSAAVGVGAEVSINIDYEQVWNGLCDTFGDFTFW